MAISPSQRFQFRKMRVRKKITGTPERPRLSVYRSLKHIYAQVIDDTKGRTLAAASSNDSDLKDSKGREAAKKVGAALAERALKAKIKKVVFDRGGRLYHGVVKSLAEGAREKGLEF